MNEWFSKSCIILYYLYTKLERIIKNNLGLTDFYGLDIFLHILQQIFVVINLLPVVHISDSDTTTVEGTDDGT